MTAPDDSLETVRAVTGEGYKYGFVTDIESDSLPPGLDEDTVRFISAKKQEPQWLLDWRLEAFRHWQKMENPDWAKLKIAPIDYQAASYYSAPKQGPKSIDEVDPELLKTYEKLGIPLSERAALAGVAVDAVFDSVSVATTFKGKLAELGIIFCSFGEAVREHPDLVRKYLGTVVPQGDNFFAALNSAVFSDGSFAYVPPGVRCPMELSTYFRINAAKSGQFERTLLIADKGAYVSYLEGCTAPQRDENQLHAAVVELIALEDAEIKYSTVQNWYPGRRRGQGRHLQFRHQARRLPRQPRQDLLDAGRDRLGHHLEISELPARRRRHGRRVLLGRDHQQFPAGRYRHEDDPSRPQLVLDHHLEGHLGGARAEYLSRPRPRPAQGPERAQLHAMQFAAHRRPLRRAYGALYRGAQSLGPGRA